MLFQITVLKNDSHSINNVSQCLEQIFIKIFCEVRVHINITLAWFGIVALVGFGMVSVLWQVPKIKKTSHIMHQ